MILNEALKSASRALSAAKIDDALIEAELLLCHTLGISKTQIYSEPERMLTQEEMSNLQQLMQRRLLREPTAYILEYCRFYGIDFYIDSRAFIPRPETELLVEKAIEFAKQRFPSGNQFTIADIGTGCGAIAISLALALPQAKIYATDISASALQVADMNCQCHKLDGQVELLDGDLLEPLPQPVDMVVANLPYIKDCELKTLSPEIINFEPMIALAGGEYGLDKVHQLLYHVAEKIRPEGCLLLEIGQEQDKAATSLISSYLPQASIEIIPDMGGINRVVKAAF